jgi:four helix bundle protein
MRDALERTEKTSNIIDYEIYRFVFETAIEIYDEILENSKSFPEDKVFIIEQIQNYSKLVCVNLAEAWHGKKNKSSFIKKLSDAAQAASKTQIWLEYASKYNFLDPKIFKKIDSKYEDIFEMVCHGMKDN